MKTSSLCAAAVVLAVAAVPGCREPNQEPLTTAEARDALEEAAVSSQAASVMSGSIELTTDFTIGGAVEAAAEEIRSYIASQLPCAEITLTGSSLSVEYGAKEGNCTYRGHTYSGVHTITVTRNEEGEVIVDHDWDALSNGVVSVTGEATVTWSFEDKTRHVVHELEWTRMSDGRTGVGSGDRLQQPLAGGIEEGFQVDGDRSWRSERGTWDLDIDGVQMRWVDPVPQTGTYTLTTPKNKTLSMSFERLDEDTITVTIESGKRSFSFDVSQAGAVNDNGMTEDAS